MSLRRRKQQALSLMLAALCALSFACATRPKKEGSELKLKDKQVGKPLTTAEVAGESPSPNSKGKKSKGTKGAGASNGASSKPNASVAAVKNCQSIVARWVPPYQRLYAKLAPGTYAPQGAPLDSLIAAQSSTCSDPNQRSAQVKAIVAAVTQHSGKVGVILPLTGPNAKVSGFILNGMRAAFQDAGVNFDQAAVLKDSGGQAAVAEQRLAELIYRDKVSLVIGGLDREEALILAKWSAELATPVLLLTREREITQSSAYAFRVYPDEKRLSETLWAAAEQRGLKRIAVLRPSGGKSDKVALYFKQAATARGGTIVHDLVYTPQDFASMQSVAATIFRTDAAERADEYRQAYRKARRRAEQEGVPFDPRMVVLKPIVDFDAVFLPDDFRTARHFVKLFKFHMVDHLPVIGNHEWRSPALVEPWDDFLDGAVFADFIGSYTKLPASISTPTSGSPYFVAPTAVVSTDFALIGYRVGRAARLATAKTQGVQRSSLPRLMMAMTDDGSGSFAKGPIFDAERQANWPTYIFKVAKDGISLDQERTTPLPPVPSAGAVGTATPQPLGAGAVLQAKPQLTSTPKP